MTQNNSPKGAMKAFTLIELLIVVAIIAILAAIAVPNFLAAQTRSKVSRVLSDQRTLRTAVEAYAVDYNKPPRMSWGDLTGKGLPYNDYFDGEPIFGCLPKDITTPIAYISSQPLDPFAANTSASADAKLYTYQTPDTMRFLFSTVGSVPVPGKPGFVYVPSSPTEARRMETYVGRYVLLSIGPMGPDRLNGSNFWLQYDPTNGTVSTGTIFTSQKFSSPTYIPPNAF